MAQAAGINPGQHRMLLGGYLLLLVALALFIVRGIHRGLVHAVDFGLHYCQAIAWTRGEDPWSPESIRAIAEREGVFSTTLDNAIALPFTLMAIAPYTVLPYPVAKIAWLLTNLLLIGAMIKVLGDAIGVRWSWSDARAVWLIGMVLILAPIQTGLGFGQLAMASVAMMALAYDAHRRRRPGCAGVWYALAGVFKPHLALSMGLYWLLRRQWRLLSVAALVSVGFLLFSTVRLHVALPEWYDLWSEQASRHLDGGMADYTKPDGHVFVNLDYAVHRLVGSKPVTEAITWSIVGALLLVAIWRLRKDVRRGSDEEVDRLRELAIAGFLAMIGLLPLYHVYYDASLMVFAIAWAVGTVAISRSIWAWVILVASVGFWVPGAAALAVWTRRGIIPEAISEAAWFNNLVMAYQPWLLLLMVIALLAAMGRRPGDGRRAIAAI
ncbi:MAG: DUF2029 domain-containing protein [Phycisphaeraceae bacterium]|nr:DUF2029 domain-containing protein [Phycisphaeraceae bacterium]